MTCTYVNNVLKSFIFILLLINAKISCSFQISLFNKLNTIYKEYNIIISPLSIFQAISLVANGANDKTQKELLKLLNNKDMDEINSINFKILNISKTHSSLKIANAIICKSEPLQLFKNFARNKYYSEIFPLIRVDEINKWCSKKTHGKINKIIEQIHPLTYMMLLNAVYFRGEWLYTFPIQKTSKQTFYNLNKFKIEVDMMQIEESFKYFEDNNLQSVELQFKNEPISALILLPNIKTNINEFIKLLDKDEEYLYSIINNMEFKHILLQLPKFEKTYSKSLKEILQLMGVDLPFDKNNADFSKIRSEKDIYISDITHKTYLKVNERGTEAAAVSVNDVYIFSLPRMMVVNRPFLFILRNYKLPKHYDIIFISKIEEVEKKFITLEDL